MVPKLNLPVVVLALSSLVVHSMRKDDNIGNIEVQVALDSSLAQPEGVSGDGKASVISKADARASDKTASLAAPSWPSRPMDEDASPVSHIHTGSDTAVYHVKDKSEADDGHAATDSDTAINGSGDNLRAVQRGDDSEVVAESVQAGGELSKQANDFWNFTHSARANADMGTVSGQSADGEASGMTRTNAKANADAPASLAAQNMGGQPVYEGYVVSNGTAFNHQDAVVKEEVHKMKQADFEAKKQELAAATDAMYNAQNKLTEAKATVVASRRKLEQTMIEKQNASTAAEQQRSHVDELKSELHAEQEALTEATHTLQKLTQQIADDETVLSRSTEAVSAAEASLLHSKLAETAARAELAKVEIIAGDRAAAATTADNGTIPTPETDTELDYEQDGVPAGVEADIVSGTALPQDSASKTRTGKGGTDAEDAEMLWKVGELFDNLVR